MQRMLCHAHWHTINVSHASWPLSLKTSNNIASAWNPLVLPAARVVNMATALQCCALPHGGGGEIQQSSWLCFLCARSTCSFFPWWERNISVEGWVSEICRSNLKVFLVSAQPWAYVSTVCMYIGWVEAGFFPCCLQTGVSESGKEKVACCKAFACEKTRGKEPTTVPIFPLQKPTSKLKTLPTVVPSLSFLGLPWFPRWFLLLLL